MTSQTNGLPTFQAQVNKRFVTSLRDTGANCVIVAQYLVKQSTLLDAPTVSCLLADGTRITVPQVEIYIQSPYFSGKTQALVFKNPSFPCILGNIPDAKFPKCNGNPATTGGIHDVHSGNPTPSGQQSLKAHVTASMDNLTSGQTLTHNGTASAVQTRASKVRQSKSPTPLNAHPTTHSRYHSR